MNQKIKVYRTCKGTDDRLTEQEPVLFYDDDPMDGPEGGLINIHDQIKYQEMLGFGGAFTESSAYNYKNIDDNLKKEFIDTYFDKEKGIGYTFCRMQINSSDFSTHVYSCDDVEDDYELKYFNIDYDKEVIIPMLKDAFKKAPELKVFASPWSPPAWMKTNGSMVKGGKLRPDCYDVWSRFVTKFIKEYEKEGIDIWGVTVQNEPKALQHYESCLYTAEDERNLVLGYLRPEFERAGYADKKIFHWDHNKERTVERSMVIMDNPRSKDCFDGVAVHLYAGDHFEGLDITHDLYPDKMIIATESCTGHDFEDQWPNGEKYAHDIMGDLNNWVCGWTDWNLFLDTEGAPDHNRAELVEETGNPNLIFGEAPICIDKKENKLVHYPTYYYIGHFSKFIKPGARRIGCSRYTDRLEACAFLNPDNTIAVVVLNRTDSDINFTLRQNGKLADFISSAHSIMTLVY